MKFQNTLRFPFYFGNNLDGFVFFFDCLVNFHLFVGNSDGFVKRSGRLRG
ncbi:barstar family protein [Flavisolibacter ginsenosidimutans]|uniref:Barstar family protein n=1 Tax=Flavisolibacter ginsenosidimutans TaxID=661481 RepID=A0A5B8UND0_9BACT|nr:barstar family protein [Flavisolibacter ginsenosidimutans]